MLVYVEVAFGWRRRTHILGSGLRPENVTSALLRWAAQVHAGRIGDELPRMSKNPGVFLHDADLSVCKVRNG